MKFISKPLLVLALSLSIFGVSNAAHAASYDQCVADPKRTNCDDIVRVCENACVSYDVCFESMMSSGSVSCPAETTDSTPPAQGEPDYYAPDTDYYWNPYR